MRILIDLQAYQNASRSRGIGRYVINITKSLINEGKNHEFLIALNDQFSENIDSIRTELAEFISPDQVKIYSLFPDISSSPINNSWRNQAATALRSAFFEYFAPDVVFLPAYFEGLWDDSVPTLVSGNYATVATLHDLIPLENPDLYLPDSEGRQAYLRRLKDLQDFDRIIAISAHVANEAHQRLRIPQEKICVALNGVGPEFTPPQHSAFDRANLMQRLGISKAFIFNNSPLEPRKNLEGLIAGFACMTEVTRSEHQIVVSGKFDAYGRNYLRHLMKAEGLPEDALVLPGYVSDQDLLALYAECALFAFPAWSEGFGLPPLEAMACGAPVLVSNATSLPEVVDDDGLLIDPGDPMALGRAMERILCDPGLQSKLRAYGPRRASNFGWKQAARSVLAEFDACVKARSAGASRAIRSPMKVAVTCMQIDCSDHLSARISALLTRLKHCLDITLVTSPGGAVDDWLNAIFDIRSFSWLEKNARTFTHFIHIGDHRAPDRFADIIRLYPGLYLEMANLDVESSHAIPFKTLPSGTQLDLVAANGMAGLVAFANDKLLNSKQTFWGERFRAAASIVLREGRADLPCLPLNRSAQAAARYRDFMGIDQQAPLIALVVRKGASVSGTLGLLREATLGHARTLIAVHVLEPKAGQSTDAAPFHLDRRIRHLVADLGPHYLGLLSAAHAIILGEDLPMAFEQRCLTDAAGLGIPTIGAAIDPADIARGLIELMSNFDTESKLVTAVSPPVEAPAVAVWEQAIVNALAQIDQREPTQLKRVMRALPPVVRGQRPSSGDLSHVARAIDLNEAYEREPLVCFDISAFAMPGAPRRLDALTRRQLFALLSGPGRNNCAVYVSDGKFVQANQFLGKELGLDRPVFTDELLHPRPGDKIIGLDLLQSFLPAVVPALRQARLRGAANLYVAAGEVGFMAGSEEPLAEMVYGWVRSTSYPTYLQIAEPGDHSASGGRNEQLLSVLQTLQEADLPAAIFAMDGLNADNDVRAGKSTIVRTTIPDYIAARLASLKNGAAKGESQIPSLHYTVMGHLLGSYSLAIINRCVATVLDKAHPGRVHYAPFETDPIAHTEGVPAAQKQTMIELIARGRPPSRSEVIIAQHWPILTPTDHPRLALALFPWEESHVPDGIVKTLTDGFDAIISPSQSVTDALVISGCALPVATIGQPFDLAPFLAIGRERQTARPINRFLHISSAFPRKGVDVLLAAWAKAFTSADKVELVIKTFPNPHNDVQEQLERLRQIKPDLAKVTLINRDTDLEAIIGYYRDCDAMVLPSRGEGYNLPALEAMAAGMPLIVTGHGGHRDFCGPEQARLIRFRFARSNSHTAGSHSLWLEPDIDDLAAALRETHDPAHAAAVEGRRQRALVVARHENDASAWLRRFGGVVQDLLDNPDSTPPLIGWVSTWKQACGVAQYSGYLIDRMSTAQQRATIVYCDERTTVEQRKDEVAFRSFWSLDRDPSNQIVEAAVDDKVDALIIQHQDGLISWERLGQIGQHGQLPNLVSIAVLHNPRNMQRMAEHEIAAVVLGLSKLTRILVHNVDDMNFLLSLGLRKNIGLFPHGAFSQTNAPWPRTLQLHDAPIIGCHGFFFPHKGIEQLIRAAAKLRRDWPGLRLRLVNARFPDGGHDGYIDQCRATAAEVGMSDAIDWHLDFLPVDEIERLLGGCDALVLAYGESDDSASGAIRTSLATMVPLVATRVKIFAELGDAVAWAENNDPDELVRAIAPLLQSPQRRREVQAGMHAWLQAHDWNRIASTLENMIAGLVKQRRFGWDRPRNIELSHNP